MRNRQAVLALSSGILALALAGCAPNKDAQAGIDPEALDQVARAIEREEDRITPQALADRLIKRSRDFVLYDLRSAFEYEQDHIDTAQNVLLPVLISAKGREALPVDQRVIVYSADGSASAQAAALLRVAGVDAYALAGGYDAWLRYIAGPTGTPANAAEARAMAKQQAVACYFQGEYVADAGLAVKTGGGYTPPLKPAQSAPAEADPLGLGLGLGLGPESAQPQPQEAPADPLGLGLGLGLGPESGSTPSPGGATPGKLNIGEGC
jgi:rhodanese-related sulfurtransferase